MIAIIVATDKNRVIGKENKIPWRVRSDLRRLSAMTRDQVVILGRKSYDSMVWYYDKSGKQMPGSCYIVITRDENYAPKHADARVAHSVPAAVELGRSLSDDVYVIGGGAIFTEALPFVDRIYLTEVQAEVDGDAYFPDLPKNEWCEVAREHTSKSDTDDYDTEVITLERK